ncbi:MAG: hypothetical protein WC413_01150 [Candidatus Nanoarchaeia archaeon]
MKSGVKRLLAGIVLTGLSLLAKAEVKFDYYGDYFTFIENNHKYSGRRVANRQVGGWYIVDITNKNNPDIIGDEKNEKGLYERMAFKFTMKKYMPEYSKIISDTNNVFKKVLKIELGTEALRFTYNRLVEIEGSLSASIATGGANLAIEPQKYIVRITISNSIDDINKTLNDTLISRYSEIEKKIKSIENVKDLEKILLEEIDKSVHTRLAKVIYQLNVAEELAKKPNRTFKEDKIMFENINEGFSSGFGIMAYYNEINKDNSMENLSKTIITRGLNGAGIPITAVIKDDRILELLKEDDHYQSAVKKSELKTKEIEKMLYKNFNNEWEGQSVDRFLNYLQKSKEEPQKELIKLYKEGVQNIDIDCDGRKEKIEIRKIEDLKGHPNFNSLSKIFINDTPTSAESFCREIVYLKKNKGKCGYYLTAVYLTTDTKPYSTNCFGDDIPYIWNGRNFQRK